MRSLYVVLAYLCLASNYVYCNTATDISSSSEVKKTEEEQLKSYDNITRWLVDNKAEFDKVIEENAQETTTKWFIKEEKPVINSAVRETDTPKAKEIKQSDKLDNIKPDKKEEIKQPNKLETINPDKKDDTKIYVVKKGDTVYSVAKDAGIKQSDLMSWNSLKSPQDLREGQKLYLSADALDEELGVDISNIPEYKYHKVKKGDTYSAIAKSYHMTKEELLHLNNISANTTLSVDQILKVKSNYKEPVLYKDSDIVKDGFIWPAVGRILIPFGTQEQGLMNEGINIGVKKGTNIKAAQEGVVIYVGDDLKSFGNLVLIQHDNNWITAYGHVDNIKVNKGTKVKKGDKIAEASDSGDVNKSQLHFELRYNLKPIDPLNYLNSYR